MISHFSRTYFAPDFVVDELEPFLLPSKEEEKVLFFLICWGCWKWASLCVLFFVIVLLTNAITRNDNAEGSGMSAYSDHMATANALRIGSPTGVNSPAAYRAGQSAPSTLAGMLRPQRSLDAIVDPSTGASSSSTSNLSHFGSSAIRFRSAQHHAGNDERFVLHFFFSI